MAAFLSDDELQRRGGDEVVAYVYELRQQLETHKARADAAVINAEQTCALIEQKFLSLTAQFAQLENEKQQSAATLERRSGELAQAQSQAHKLELDAIKHESDMERVSFELSEARKSRRELLDVVEQKNIELDEKNSSIKSYLEKIVILTDERSMFEGKVREHEAEVGRSHAVQARLQQEKELLEQHNVWLNEELNGKVKGLMEERRTSADLEADLQSKLLQAERLYKEAKESVQRSNERIGDLEAKLTQTREELRYTKEQAILQENHLSTEITTATKLADLYKQSSDEWSRKSNELEGVIKALETHLNQVEAEYREKLDKEIQAREAAVKDSSELKEKLEKALADGNTDAVRDGDLALPVPPMKMMTESMDKQLALELHGDGAMLPSIGKKVSGTALAAALLRDGWSLSTMYTKYQEAVDAWRHERHERKHSQALLERVLHEIELKAEVIFDERAEHERMVEAYHVMEEKLHYSMADQSTLENSIKDLKADLRKKEREVKGAQKEISDLQTQVAGLLKECAEVKQRFEAGDWHPNGDALPYYATSEPDSSAADIVISEKLVTFKDIRGMVEQNSQLRVLVRSLAEESEQKEAELKEYFSAELKRRADDAARKVAETLKKYKEKTEVIETLQATVGMYKRLYEEELRSRYTSPAQITSTAMTLIAPEGDGRDYGRLLHTSQEEIRRAREESDTRIKTLEDELNKAKLELTNARVERARVDAEAGLAREQMTSLTREAENRRREMDGVLSRNMEFSQTITNYQQRLRESSQKMQAAEELVHKLKIEAAVLEREKELLASAEKRASEEVASLSDRVHRLQASLDTYQSVEEARESVRAAEMKKLQDDWSHMQKEWAEGKRELEVERSHSRDLIVSRDKAVKDATDRIEASGKELADAIKAMSAAETRAQVAEVRCTELEASLKSANDKIAMALSGGKRSDTGDKSSEEIDAEILANLQEARMEVEQLKEDLVASKGHIEQYKRIAEANEEALKQLEAAHNRYKADVEHMKEIMEADVNKLRGKISTLEAELTEKDGVNAAMAEEKEASLRDTRREISTIQESLSSTQAALQEANERVKTLKQEVDKYHHQYRDAQRNYERQVLLQADTIREMTQAEERVKHLEESEGLLRKQAETAETQLVSAQVAWAVEKSYLEAAKVETEKKWKELEEQNRLLLDRLEAMHITSAEHSRKEFGEAGDSQSAVDKDESDLQNVIRYLRRSKETAETEVSLLKQERLRLQRQLDAALRSAEDALSTLRREQETARTSLYSDEEFRSLQAQVRELNLLRESNSQLREENRRNFEDSRESREKARLAYIELEPLQKRLKEKEVELESSAKELEMQRAETQRWQNRVTQLLEKYKTIDVDDYQRVKSEREELQVSVAALKSGVEAAKGELEVSQKESEATRIKCEKMQSDITEKDNKITELEKNVEALKVELDRFRRHATFQKRRIDNLTKEKDELSKENENLSKQTEELKANAGKRISMESRQEVARQEAALRQEATARQEQAQRESENVLKEKEAVLKERDARIQTLEKILERERESLRKEKALRQRDQRTFMDLTQKAASEKKRIESELEALKRVQQVEPQVISAGTSDPPPRTDIEERVVSVEAVMNAVSEPPVSVQEVTAQPTANAPSASSSLVAQATGVSSTESIPHSAPMETSTVATEVTSSTASAFGAVVAAISGISTGTNASGARQAIRTNLANIPPASTRQPFRPPPAQVPVSDLREKEMAQLRREIEERERNAANIGSQARKSARRLIRPRIEPAGQQENVLETGELAGDGTVDLPEADIEFVEQGKSSGSGGDAAEPEPTFGTGPLVVEVLTPVTESPLPLSVPVNASLPSVSAPARKRPATAPTGILTEEIPIDQEAKSETAPPQKRARPVESLPEVVTEEASASASTSVAGSKVQGDSGQETQEALPEMSGVLAATEDLMTAVMSLGPESDRERPLAESSDVQPQKRPRFIRPEAVLLPVQPVVREEEMAEGEKSDVAKVVDLGDVTREVDVAVETKGTAEVSAVDLGTTEQEPTEVSVQVDQSQEHESQGKSSTQSVVSSLVEASQSAGEGQLSQSGLDIDMNEPIFEEDVNIPATFDVSGAEIGETVEGDVAGGDVAVQRVTSTFSESIVTEEIEDVTEMEEGEMAMEVTVTETSFRSETILEEVSETRVQDRPTTEREDVVVRETTPAALSEQNAGSSQTPVEARDSTSVLASQSSSEALAGTLGSEALAGTVEVAGDVVGLGETSAHEQKGPQEHPLEGHSMLTRLAAVKSTTIHLAERAKERAVLRRGLNPPSPAARGRGRTTRGGKRAPSGGRGGGRVISTGVRGRGQAGGSPGPGSDATRSGNQAGAGAAGQSDPSQTSSPSNNPYDGTPRDGDD
ncbi:nucleoprotein TPR [Marchantia polymorpha subsp. ruderalis]|uniref:Uncharacterized protein n=1 Tax=Marchantia polymorpha TaxID=3197 RepID=A0A2R6X1T4_MARPO|nr:hypothetical protein MARPO_0042s0082 [Marchantia polymorpha]PTQ40047.1 hypothetical protein MARPO_0042s0082 [Marchantia polymorpha]BBN02351.1 hypothetical protein Mp_2g14600 [Marchantia polymorpha subsp. ruderalis]BBN02352.1 hypothetical protein Mp_2g14600 [Marchantia polymorpha subsp. ruderalis]|eukprot:PTQ40046.1 hypothetical protein MARPO_0042s0082 [Marchantia polymorpha]